jgi:hypothetical protein
MSETERFAGATRDPEKMRQALATGVAGQGRKSGAKEFDL